VKEENNNNDSSSKFQDFLSSISINKPTIFTKSPQKSSIYENKSIVAENEKNNKAFLKNFVKMLDFNEKLAEKIGNRISIENKSETKEMTKIISENKLKTLFELDKEKPPKRQPRPFNPEKNQTLKLCS